MVATLFIDTKGVTAPESLPVVLEVHLLSFSNKDRFQDLDEPFIVRLLFKLEVEYLFSTLQQAASSRNGSFLLGTVVHSAEILYFQVELEFLYHLEDLVPGHCVLLIVDER